ncbi:MAG: rhodanese-like domain-containing protein, partial [Cyclobacteriaceae bacterium]|nr:rhodanese-like domain-containing protein [Cyclobacteriaceae bacterium]
VDLEELDSMIRNKNIVLLDVRPQEEYKLGHITGAVSVPVHELKSVMDKFSKNKEIIAYCRGPFCVLADEAVKLLGERGFKVRRLDEGYPEWKLRMLEKSLTN